MFFLVRMVPEWFQSALATIIIPLFPRIVAVDFSPHFLGSSVADFLYEFLELLWQPLEHRGAVACAFCLVAACEGLFLDCFW